MKLLDTILISFSVGFFIIGVHQLITLGLAQAYWVFMLSAILLIGYQIRKKNRQQHHVTSKNDKRSSKSEKIKHKRSH